MRRQIIVDVFFDDEEITRLEAEMSLDRLLAFTPDELDVEIRYVKRARRKR